MKVLLNSFHLNGHTLGFHLQTQKLQPYLLTEGLTLGVKGLTCHILVFILLTSREKYRSDRMLSLYLVILCIVQNNLPVEGNHKITVH